MRFFQNANTMQELHSEDRKYTILRNLSNHMSKSVGWLWYAPKYVLSTKRGLKIVWCTNAVMSPRTKSLINQTFWSLVYMQVWHFYGSCCCCFVYLLFLVKNHLFILQYNTEISYNLHEIWTAHSKCTNMFWMFKKYTCMQNIEHVSLDQTNLILA